MVDEITHASMVALLARWQLAWSTREIQKVVRDTAVAKIKESGAIIEECKAMAKSLGFDREDNDNWGKLISEFVPGAQELYAKVKSPEMPPWDYAIKARDPVVNSQTEEPKPPEPNSETSDQASAEKPPRPTIRKIVLDRLEEAGETGTKASDIRKFIEETYSEQIHEKTVGMTLYRLLQDTLVLRKGHTWFLAPHHGAETKNPGAVTPGHIDDLL